jgi:hypothetical protein
MMNGSIELLDIAFEEVERIVRDMAVIMPECKGIEGILV